jgi:di/tricarboxylate transporter
LTARIDWSTVFMVGGIVTFVGVLQKLGAVDLLGQSAMNAGSPLLAALIICMIAGLVSPSHPPPGSSRRLCPWP